MSLFTCFVLYVCPRSALDQQTCFNYKLILSALYIDRRLNSDFIFLHWCNNMADERTCDV